jgi:hypothetical protein
VKLLLDTRAFIWWDGDQSKLSEVASVTCQSRSNTLPLSLVSVWELQIKVQLGKIALRLPLADVLRDQQQQNGLLPAIRWRCFGKMEYVAGCRRLRSADLPNDRTPSSIVHFECVLEAKGKAGKRKLDAKVLKSSAFPTSSQLSDS